MTGILGVLVTAYLLGVTPLLLGLLWNCIFREERQELSDAYVKGYFLMFAAFWCAAEVCILRGRWLSTLGKYWILGITVVNVVSLAISVRTFPNYLRRMRSAMKKIKWMKAAVLVSILLIVFSILFLKPIADDVVEHALTAVNTNTIFIYHPYTGEAHPEQLADQRLAPLAMLYAVVSWAGRLPAATVIKVASPVFLLLFFCSAVWQMGRRLFAKQEARIPVFFFLVLLVSSYPVYSAVDYLEAAIWTNSWNGSTLLNCVILPYLVIYGWAPGSSVKAGGSAKAPGSAKANGRRRRIAGLLFWVISALAAQLTYVRGAYYVTLIAALWLIIKAGRKGYGYAIAHKRD
jgi:hypothetical protein